ncbi:Chondroitin polymerase [Candidatus Ornithobacterium hominis]|uniref:glycosyltransferase family 2 protein n=1 Tax=Candidatus Ornithobacterium hominis TaxID=2497989 RepID=UPI000E5B0B54|nr:glycosyltransferase family 2 protein [Candidatus Ornithobacterium hominis]SZD73707.1 Chondroitin polymerase [Candidatus Ornithobacterium hominis]
MSKQVSIIISTYNQPKWLEKVLWGYHVQSFGNFELIVADDGSGEQTRALISQIKPLLNYELKHVWHPDDGFQKTKILNKAILASAADYLIFSDGDCIPRKDFVETHINQRAEGRFLSGGYFKLPMETSQMIQKKDIFSQNCFDLNWLKNKGLKNSIKNLKLIKNKFALSIMNTITSTKPTWNGHNSSGWKKDILAANGFDERMQYGGEDRELGERLENAKIRGKQIRYKAICLHLDHARGYVNQKSWEINEEIRKRTRNQKITFSPFGVEKQSV